MISIIICSRTTSISHRLENNIKASIGVEYEIVLINNHQNQYNIFEAYNLGVERSKYQMLCFMHDDIEFHTLNWGQKVIQHFADERTGAIGIGGTPYAAAMPGAWWGGEIVNEYVLPVGDDTTKIIQAGIPKNNRNEVVLLDGVWLCIRKSLFKKIKFDVVNYNGFHFYDVDICMQIQQLGYKLFSIFDILIRHYTQGRMDKSWCDNAIAFNNKWGKVLPVSIGRFSYSQRCEAELKTLKEYVYNLIYNGYGHKTAYRLAIRRLSGFSKGYLYYKTPVHLLKYGYKLLVKYP